MADNTTLNPGSGGDVIATDDIGGVKYQVVKVSYGAADSVTQVEAANPLPTVVSSELPAGTQTIGKVEVNALSNFIQAYSQSNAVFVGDASATVKRVAIGGNTNGNNTLVAAVTSKKIRILSFFVMSAGTVNMYVEDATTGTDIIGTNTFPIPLVVNVGFVLAHNPHGYGETVAGEALNMVLDAAVAVSGCMTYIEV